MNKTEIVSNPLVPGTKNVGPESDCCFQWYVLHILIHQERIIKKQIFSLKVSHFIIDLFQHILYLLFFNPLVSGTKYKGPESDCRYWGPFLRVFSITSPRGNNLKKNSYKSFPFLTNQNIFDFHYFQPSGVWNKNQRPRKRKIQFSFIHRLLVQKGPPLSEKKIQQYLLLFCVNAQNGAVDFGAVFSIKKVDRDKLLKKSSEF